MRKRNGKENEKNTNDYGFDNNDNEEEDEEEEEVVQEVKEPTNNRKKNVYGRDNVFLL